MTFTCKVTGAKPAVDKYKFYFKNGNTPIAENSKRTYQINSVKGSDQGTYKCVPHNAVRDGEQATVMLTVNGKLWMKYDLYLKNKEKRFSPNCSTIYLSAQETHVKDRWELFSQVYKRHVLHVHLTVAD